MNIILSANQLEYIQSILSNKWTKFIKDFEDFSSIYKDDLNGIFDELQYISNIYKKLRIDLVLNSEQREYLEYILTERFSKVQKDLDNNEIHHQYDMDDALTELEDINSILKELTGEANYNN